MLCFLFFCFLLSQFNSRHVLTLATFTPENVPCDVYTKIVPVPAGYPHYMRLFRCQGADFNPARRICAHTKADQVEILGFTNGVAVQLKVDNHTQCEFKCEKDATSCNKHQKWSEDECKCECTKEEFDCGSPTQYWDRSLCKCECTEDQRMTCRSRGYAINPDTCDCMDEKSGRPAENMVPVKYVVAIVVLELVLVVAVCSIVFYFCFHKRTTTAHQVNGPDDVPLKRENGHNF